MAALTLKTVVLGVDDMARAVAFWTEALGYVAESGEDAEWWTTLRPADGDGPRLGLQLSESAVPDRPRVHVDLFAPDTAAQGEEVDRLVGLGARRVEWDLYPDDPDFIVLADTEGNLFCVIDDSHP
jgi:catechol 2,3-dioxygenase-like lactoylglutathione lyase family enzyme